MNRGLFVALFLGGCVIALCLWWFGHAPDFFQGHYGRASEAGSMFGLLSTLFTGLGFVGLIYTVVLQREQLQQAKTEALEARKTGEQQRFESTFFQLLNLHSGIVSSARLETLNDGTHVYIGRDVLTFLERQLQSHLGEDLWRSWINANNGLPNRRGFLEDACESWRAEYSIYVDHYFRVLYRLLRHIDTRTQTDKNDYAKIVRAQLTSKELVLLFYNSFTPGGARMRAEVERYALLKHVYPDDLADPFDRHLYNPSAYTD